MTDNWYDLIEDYLLGKLPDSLCAEFESAMAEDPALARAVQEHRIEWEANELLAEKILRAQIREAFEEHRPDSGNRFSKYWKWILASILLLATAVVLMRKYQQPVAPSQDPFLPAAPSKADSLTPKPPVAQVRPDPEPGTPKRPRTPPPSQRAPDYKVLALAAYQTPEGLAMTRAQIEAGDTLALAVEAFTQKDFRLAARYLSPLPADSGQEGLALRGHAHFLAGDYAAARTDFSALLAGGVYIRDAQWFGLLAAMATPGANKKDLMRQLETIRLDTKHPWQKDAAALWDKLKQ